MEINKGLKIWAIAATVAGVLLLAGVVALLVHVGNLESVSSANDIYKTSLENSYQRSYNELIESVNGIEAELSKAVVSNSADMQLKILGQVSVMAANAQSNISALPINASIEKTTKFINQTGDYASSLSNSLIKDRKPLSENEKNELTNLKSMAKRLRATMDGVMEKMGDALLTDGIEKTSPLSDGIGKGEEEEFPRLVYDGPFSDDAEENVKSMLSGKVFTPTELEERLRSVLSDYKIKSVKTTQRIYKGFEILMFSVTTEEGEVFDVNMSEKGGYICQIDNYTLNDGDTAELDTSVCLDKAESFAKKLGYDVKPIYVSKTLEGCIYVNLCYIEDGVIVYPDMLKLTVDTTSGVVTGLEGYKYLLNHTARNIEKPAHTAQAALEKLSAHLTVTNTALTLIPQMKNEKLCYEFKCVDDDIEFFVYINAQNLEEEEILKIVKGSEGYTIM